MEETSIDDDTTDKTASSGIITDIHDEFTSDGDTIVLVEIKGKPDKVEDWVDISTIGPAWTEYWTAKKAQIERGEAKRFDPTALRQEQATADDSGSKQSKTDGAKAVTPALSEQDAAGAVPASQPAPTNGSIDVPTALHPNPPTEPNDKAIEALTLKSDLQSSKTSPFKQVARKTIDQVNSTIEAGNSASGCEAAGSRAKTSAGDTSAADIRNILSPDKSTPVAVPKAAKRQSLTRGTRKLKPGPVLAHDEKTFAFEDKPELDIDAVLRKRKQSEANTAVHPASPVGPILKKRKTAPTRLDGETKAKHIKDAESRAAANALAQDKRSPTKQDTTARPSTLALAVARVQGDTATLGLQTPAPIQSVASALQNGDILPGDDISKVALVQQPVLAQDENTLASGLPDILRNTKISTAEPTKTCNTVDKTAEMIRSVVAAPLISVKTPTTAPAALRIPRGRGGEGRIDQTYRRRSSPVPPRRRSASPRSSPLPQDTPVNVATDYATWAAKKNSTCQAWVKGQCPRTELDCVWRHAYIFYHSVSCSATAAEITCAFWLNGHCKHPNCSYAHYDTGIHAMRSLAENQRTLQAIFNQRQHSQSAQSKETINQAPTTNGLLSKHGTSDTPAFDLDRYHRFQPTGLTKDIIPRPTTPTKDDALTGSRTFLQSTASQVLPPINEHTVAQVLANLFRHRAPPITVTPIWSGAPRETTLRLCFLSQQEHGAAISALGSRGSAELQDGSDWLAQVAKFRWSDQIGYVDDCPKHLSEYLSAVPRNGDKSKHRYVLLRCMEGSILLTRDCRTTRSAFHISTLPTPEQQVLFRVFSNNPCEENPKPMVLKHNSALLSFDFEWAYHKYKETSGGLTIWLISEDISDEGTLALRFLFEAHGLAVTIISTVSQFNSTSVSSGAFIICPNTRPDRIPNLYKHLQKKHHTYSTRDRKTAEDKGALFKCIKLFPRHTGMLITNEVFRKPTMALQVLQRFRQIEIGALDQQTVEKGKKCKRGLLLAPPWLEEHLAWLQGADGNKMHDDVLKAWHDLDSDPACELRYNGGKNWIELFWDPSKVTDVRRDARRYADLLVGEFVMWTFRHADRVGRLVVIHESAAKPGVKDPYGWMQSHGHIDVLTPEQWLAKQN